MSDWDDNIWQGATAVTSAINGLASSIGTYKAQKEQNAATERLARERNLWEAEEAQKNRDWQTEQWEKEKQYEDPSNKRELLERAGINPYSLYGASIATPSGGTGAQASFETPQRVVEDGFAKGLMEVSRNNIESARVLAASRKDNADAQSQEIYNVVAAQRAAEDLRSVGLNNEAQMIDNIKNRGRLPYEIVNAELTNQDIFHNIQLKECQQILQKYDLEFLKPQEYKKVLEDTNLLIEKQLTEQEYREHMKRMDRNGALQAAASMIVARVQEQVAPSQIEANNAAAENQRAQAGVYSQEYVAKGIENDIAKVLALPRAKNELRNLILSGDLTEANIEHTYRSNKLLQKEIDWFTFKSIAGAASSALGSGGGAMMWMKLLAP